MNLILDNDRRDTSLSFTEAKNLFLKDLQDSDQLKYFGGIWLLSNSPQGSSYVNILNGTSGSQSGTATYNSGFGWYGNGSTGFIDLGYNPRGSAIGSLNDYHISVFSRSKFQFGGLDMGANDGTSGTWISTQFTQGNMFTRINSNASSSSYTNIDPRGWFYAERTSSTSTTLYRDGVSLGAKATTSTAIPNKNFYTLSGSAAAGLTLPSSGVTSLVTVGKSGVNTTVVSGIINNYFTRIGYPIKTVYGFGDSFMFGTNASSQANTWYNKSCVYKKYDWHNMGVGGQAITPGGSQGSFNLANIPTKSSYDAGMIVDWGLNDALMIYFNGTRTFAQFQAAVHAFFQAALAKGWSGKDIFWVTGWQVLANQWYTQAQLNLVFNEIRSICSSYGAKASSDIGGYFLASDNVHPKDDTAYTVMFNQIKNQIPF